MGAKNRRGDPDRLERWMTGGGVGRRPAGGHSLHTGGVTGSIPVAPTIFLASSRLTAVPFRSYRHEKAYERRTRHANPWKIRGQFRPRSERHRLNTPLLAAMAGVMRLPALSNSCPWSRYGEETALRAFLTLPAVSLAWTASNRPLPGSARCRQHRYVRRIKKEIAGHSDEAVIEEAESSESSIRSVSEGRPRHPFPTQARQLIERAYNGILADHDEASALK